MWDAYSQIQRGNDSSTITGLNYDSYSNQEMVDLLHLL